MRFSIIMQKLCFILVTVFVFEQTILAQQPQRPELTTPPQSIDQTPNKTNSIETEKKQNGLPKAEDSSPRATDQTSAKQNDRQQAEKESNQTIMSEEEAAILPIYNSFLKEYLLGPEDVISVEVFNQPNYSKTGITVPPTARISYPLIPGGVAVGGKTTEQVAEIIKKKLDEFIIDPQVTVSLDKVGSARFSVLGQVNQPGVKLMNRRYNLYEAVAEAGGISRGGDKKRVILMRLSPQGSYSQIIVDFEKLQKGKTAVLFLAPGDQVIVPKKKWDTGTIFNIVGQALAWRLISGF